MIQALLPGLVGRGNHRLRTARNGYATQTDSLPNVVGNPRTIETRRAASV